MPIEHSHGRNLPHWQQPGGVYFVTFRTGDSVPAPVLREWLRERESWLRLHPEPLTPELRREFHRRFTDRMHRFLDDCHGECPFKNREARAIIEEVLLHSDGTNRYALDEYVVMPNHVHVLLCPGDGVSLTDITEIWKRVTAHRLNKLLRRHGTLWQHESFDHQVRGPEHLERFRRYIRENPRRLPPI